MELRISIDGTERLVVRPAAASAEAAEARTAARAAAAADRYSSEYTGRHDHGLLPEPRAHAAFEAISRFLEEARVASSALLGPLAEAEKEEFQAAQQVDKDQLAAARAAERAEQLQRQQSRKRQKQPSAGEPVGE